MAREQSGARSQIPSGIHEKAESEQTRTDGRETAVALQIIEKGEAREMLKCGCAGRRENNETY